MGYRFCYLELCKSVIDQIIEQLITDEGMEVKPYRDTEGYITIGVGRCLDTKGITKDEAIYLLNNDVQEVIKKLSRNQTFLNLDDIRQSVLINMAFNLGHNGLLKFRNMWDAIESEDFERASEEMLDSKWANQVGRRARRLANEMRTGEADY